MEMEEDILKFKRSEKLGEIIIAVFVIALFIIIQLPITPTPNKPIIYISAVLYVLFAFIWHKIKIPVAPANKNFVESVIGIIAISIVVRANGGSSSHFNFLYLLPNFAVSTTSTKWHAIGVWIVTVFCIAIEAFLFPAAQVISLGLINIWAVALVSFYGRSLSQEVGSAQGAATTATIEKEKSINKLKDEFVFLISHELRGPITAIRGYIELFLSSSDKMPDAAIDLAKLAFKQSDKLNNLIIQLLDLSRLETEKFKLTSEKFDLNPFLKEIIDSTQIETQEKRIKMESKIDKTPTIVFADKERVREAILNLIDYSIKNTGELGKIWVWDEVREGFAHVSISDTDSGMTPEEQEQVFTRFFGAQGSPANPTKDKNLGLGLYLCKQLVEKMGGQINVQSQLGKGTTFSFTVPLSKT